MSPAPALLAILALLTGVACTKVSVSESVGHHLEEPHDFYAKPKYDYKYGVEDFKTGDHKSHWEKRDGDEVTGAYSLMEPDGTFRTVSYHADKKSGFNAVVTRHGKGLHPLQQEGTAHEGEGNQASHHQLVSHGSMDLGRHDTELSKPLFVSAGVREVTEELGPAKSSSTQSVNAIPAPAAARSQTPHFYPRVNPAAKPAPFRQSSHYSTTSAPSSTARPRPSTQPGLHSRGPAYHSSTSAPYLSAAGSSTSYSSSGSSPSSSRSRPGSPSHSGSKSYSSVPLPSSSKSFNSAPLQSSSKSFNSASSHLESNSFSGAPSHPSAPAQSNAYSGVVSFGSTLPGPAPGALSHASLSFPASHSHSIPTASNPLATTSGGTSTSSFTPSGGAFSGEYPQGSFIPSSNPFRSTSSITGTLSSPSSQYKNEPVSFSISSPQSHVPESPRADRHSHRAYSRSGSLTHGSSLEVGEVDDDGFPKFSSFRPTSAAIAPLLQPQHSQQHQETPEESDLGSRVYRHGTQDDSQRTFVEVGMGGYPDSAYEYVQTAE